LLSFLLFSCVSKIIAVFVFINVFISETFIRKVHRFSLNFIDISDFMTIQFESGFVFLEQLGFFVEHQPVLLDGGKLVYANVQIALVGTLVDKLLARLYKRHLHALLHD